MMSDRLEKLNDFAYAAPAEACVYVSLRGLLRCLPELKGPIAEKDELPLLFIFRTGISALVALVLLDDEFIDISYGPIRQMDEFDNSSQSKELSELIFLARTLADSASLLGDQIAGDPIAESTVSAFNSIQRLVQVSASNSDILSRIEGDIDGGYRNYSKNLGLKRHQIIFWTPLFGDMTGSASISKVSELLGDDGKWKFWLQWFVSLASGDVSKWELWTRIVKMPDEIWMQGPEKVASEIERIEAQFLLEKVSLAEKVLINERTGKFYALAQDIKNPDFLGATMSQVEDALEDVVSQEGNGIREDSREARVLRRTSSKYGNDPQRIEMDFSSVHASLTRQIASNELPASEENLGLLRALEEGVQGIRATHPQIAQNRKMLNAQRLLELSEKEKAVFADAAPILSEISEGQLKTDFEDDIAFILDEQQREVRSDTAKNSRNLTTTGYDETVRTLSRAAKISLKLRTIPSLIHRIDKSAAYKGARIIATIAAIVTIGITIL